MRRGIRLMHPRLPELPNKFTTGDRVVIEYGGDPPALGTVHLASPNGRSLIIHFDDPDEIGIPVVQQDDGGYVMLLGGAPITLRRPQ